MNFFHFITIHRGHGDYSLRREERYRREEGDRADEREKRRNGERKKRPQRAREKEEDVNVNVNVNVNADADVVDVRQFITRCAARTAGRRKGAQEEGMVTDGGVSAHARIQHR